MAIAVLYATFFTELVRKKLQTLIGIVEKNQKID